MCSTFTAEALAILKANAIKEEHKKYIRAIRWVPSTVREEDGQHAKSRRASLNPVCEEVADWRDGEADGRAAAAGNREERRLRTIMFTILGRKEDYQQETPGRRVQKTGPRRGRPACDGGIQERSKIF